MNLLRRSRESAFAVLVTSAVGIAISGCALFGSTAPAAASDNQVAIFQDPGIEQDVSPPISDAFIQQHLQALRSLGVDVLRIGLAWTNVAPDANSRTRPAFDAADPNAYDWEFYDRLVSTAESDGIAVDLLVTGGPSVTPLWATQSGAPPPNSGSGSLFSFDHVWKPSASEYGQFVRAVGSHFRSVHFWEIWDEANWGPALAPQVQGGAMVGAALYRSLLDAGYSALQGTGHGHDTILAGNYTQDGSSQPNATNSSAPLTFTRALYCVNASYAPLRGSAAQSLGCPTTRAGSRQFPSAHPALFRVSGFGVHPYQYSNPPSRPDYPNPNGVEYNEIPHFVSVLNSVQRAYGSHKRMAVYNTEYGYQTRPPAAGRNPTPNTAAVWLNQAEYIAWRSNRISSFDQYELQDGGWFNTGLVNANGKPKATFYAWQMPIWLPSTSESRGHSIEVWGDVRPAHFAHGAQYAYIQFARRNSSSFSSVLRVRITNSRGYFDAHVKLPSSGQVRIAWSYPAGDATLYNTLSPSQTRIYSRTTSVSVH